MSGVKSEVNAAILVATVAGLGGAYEMQESPRTIVEASAPVEERMKFLHGGEEESVRYAHLARATATITGDVWVSLTGVTARFSRHRVA